MSYLGSKPANSPLTSELIPDNTIQAADIQNGVITPAKLSTGYPTWDSSGNVGIGTSSPLTKFTVSGGYISQTDGTIRTYLGADGSGGSLVGTTTNQYFRFITNDTERMRIDSSGRVTMPYQPAFAARKTNGATASGNVLVFDSVSLNVGSCYNSSNGRFTAPIAGNYYISASILRQTGNQFEFWIRKNGSIIADAEDTTSTSNYAQVSSSIVVSLAANDYIDIYVNFGVAHGGGYYEIFTGFLIG